MPDGGWMIVRDHFLHDPIYHWHDVAEELPHAITQAMIFKPDQEMKVQVLDIGTMFTEPANYLRHLKGSALYVRDRWDTPASDIRSLGEDEMRSILEKCDAASSRLYRRIAAMPRRERIIAGATVYYAEFIAPWARRAGVWEKLLDEYDFFEFDPVASEVYYRLVKEGEAATLVPQQFLMGTAYQHIPDQAGPEAQHSEHYPSLHFVAVRGFAKEIPGDPSALEDAGLVKSSKAGYMLTAEGRLAHQALLAAERESIDRERLGQVYEQGFLPVNVELKAVTTRWQETGAEDQGVILEEIATVVARVEPVLLETGESIPRFTAYPQRLREALELAEGGDSKWVASPLVDSIHTVWMELHEDYLQVLALDREEEGSF
jgi:hypothetical protein